VTQPPSLAEPCHHIVIVGAGAAGRGAHAALLAAGVTDVVILDKASGREVVGSRFDDDADTWLLTTAGAEIFRAHVVVAAYRPAQVPWLPNIFGRNDFRGASFHAAQWPPDFDPAGKRVAVIGADATAGHYVPRLTDSAASVTVFAHPPRRIVPELPLPSTRAKRWLRRRIRPAADDGPAPALVGSAIVAISASSIRTADDVDHDADAIIYGTGFAIPDRIPDTTLVGAGGLSIRRAWDDGMEPYFGVAVRGFPNYFFVSGPDVGAQARYVAQCVGLMKDTASTRIEVRRSTQQVFNERVYARPANPLRVAPISKAFDLSSSAPQDDGTYDGAATLTIAGTEHRVRVRLAGHLDPIDGQYHWQGTVFGSSSQPLPDEALRQARTATLTVGARSAPARIIERTPWGTHTVAGVGAPPYALS
jgi:cation diffusion facilitator CzcD-associated flavoprotein CzcO